MHAIAFTFATLAFCGFAGLIYYREQRRLYRAAVAELRLQRLIKEMQWRDYNKRIEQAWLNMEQDFGKQPID